MEFTKQTTVCKSQPCSFTLQVLFPQQSLRLDIKIVPILTGKQISGEKTNRFAA
jgi:hypothetical protein